MISYPNVKVNLGLSVLRKRPDAYHDIETLFVPFFGCHDTLEVIAGDDYSRISARLFGDSVTGECKLPTLAQAIREDGKVMITIARKEGVDWDPLKDLTVKAYGLLDADFNLPPVKIFLEKTSPVGAGLGGGSADAAFALRMLSELFSLGLDDAALASYAARLGSDCAFFIYNRPMFGSGRGEVLSPYDIDLCRWEIRVAFPEGVSVSTAEAYRGVLASKQISEGRLPLAEALKKPVTQWKDFVFNDFEATVFPAHPEIPALKRKMYEEGAVYAAMSGSGSAVFGLFPVSDAPEISI